MNLGSKSRPSPICPLCGEANHCAGAQGTGAPCWCTDAAISSEALARVPPVQRNQTCICPKCAVGE